MSAKTTKRIQLRLRLFKVRGNNEMVFLHRPSCLLGDNSAPSQESHTFNATQLKYSGEANQ